MRRRIPLTFAVSVLAVLLLATGASADSGSPHVVRAGETLANIAAQHGVSTSALARANGIANPNFIRIGQRLVIPAAGVSSGGAAKPAVSTYVVRRGDTLGAIARRLGVSVATLTAANGISNPNRIYPGMVLRVTGGSGGGSGSSGGSKAGGTRFVVDISAQHCWLYSGGVLIGDWRCSTGRAGARTVPGTYRVQSKIGEAYGSSWGFWMPYWLGVYWAGSMENGIHGLPYYKSTGKKTWAGLVGTPITFGCVMLDDANARKLWQTAYIGMPVVITP